MTKNNTIPGIYNYCDRWCERCPMSHRCLLYLQELEMGLHADEEGGNQSEFWDQLEQKMIENMEDIEEFISDYEDFVPPDEEELEEALKEMEITSQKARRSRLLKLYARYRENIKPWMEEHSDEALITWFFSGKYDSAQSEKKYKMATDCVEVLEWYFFFSEAKFYRAMTGKIAGEEIRFEPDYPTDSEASAKVAMIGVDRSRQALISLWDLLEKESGEESLLQSLSLLDHVKREALREFPNAPNVKRPGFED